MSHDPIRPLVAPPQPGGDPATPSTATCPMCHTAHPSLTRAAVVAGEDWQCSRCGQHWDAERLATVSAYAAWASERDGVLGAPARPTPHLRIIPGGK